MDTRGRERSGKGEEGEREREEPLGNVSFMHPTVADTTGGKIYREEREEGENKPVWAGKDGEMVSMGVGGDYLGSLFYRKR